VVEEQTLQTSDTTGDFDVVHARVLRFFPELVLHLGGNPGRLYRTAGINPGQRDSGSARLSYRQLTALLELAAAELDCPDFGMQLASRQKGQDMFGPLGNVMKSSNTFGDALGYVSRHNYAHSLAARLWLETLPSRDAVFSGHDILAEGIPNKSQTMEQMLLLGHLAAMEMTGGRARAREVYFRHHPVSSARTYHRYFGCQVRFGQNENGIVFSRRDMETPIVDPDVRAHRAMVAYIDQHFTRRRPPTHAEVRGVIMRLLGIGDCSNARVAAELNLHLRTLHRRLSAEGTSFQQVKDEVRRDIMLYYLQQTDLELSRISEKLGFSEQSVMTRRCNTWFKAPPTQVRVQGKAFVADS